MSTATMTRAAKGAAAATSFEVGAAAFAEALSSALAVARDGRAIPILGCVMMRAQGGTLDMQATDMEVAVTHRIAGAGDLPPTVVSAARLHALLAPVPKSAQIRFTPGDGFVSVSVGGIRGRLSTLEAEDFPAAAAAVKAPEVTMPAASLLRLLTRAWHAVAADQTRAYLNGLSLRPGGLPDAPLLVCEATDGHQLFRATEPLPEGWAAPPIILPKFGSAQMAKLLATEGSGEIKVRATDTRIEVVAENWSLVSKLIDGTYPDTDRVLPMAEPKGTLVVSNAPALAALVGAAVSVADDKTHAVKLVADGTALRVTGVHHEAGMVEADVPDDVARWEGVGPADGVGFQARYVLALLGRCEGEARMRFTEVGAPARFDCPAGLAVIMPVRI